MTDPKNDLAEELVARRKSFDACAMIGNPRAQDAETKHDPANGQFTSGGGGGGGATKSKEHTQRQEANALRKKLDKEYREKEAFTAHLNKAGQPGLALLYRNSTLGSKK